VPLAGTDPRYNGRYCGRLGATAGTDRRITIVDRYRTERQKGRLGRLYKSNEEPHFQHVPSGSNSVPKREFVVGFVIGRSFGCLGRARSQHVPRRLATVPAARCGELDQDDQDGKRERNDRVIVIPSWHDRLGELERASELPSALREKIERFFLSF